ncbi:hypothetical protein DMB37_31365 [Nocardia sp. CS682]|nr:hypothetical protein DMB37_31365 [Nocardia sp. CS682]
MWREYLVEMIERKNPIRSTVIDQNGPQFGGLFPNCCRQLSRIGLLLLDVKCSLFPRGLSCRPLGGLQRAQSLPLCLFEQPLLLRSVSLLFALLQHRLILQFS